MKTTYWDAKRWVAQATLMVALFACAPGDSVVVVTLTVSGPDVTIFRLDVTGTLEGKPIPPFQYDKDGGIALSVVSPKVPTFAIIFGADRRGTATLHISAKDIDGREKACASTMVEIIPSQSKSLTLQLHEPCDKGPIPDASTDTMPSDGPISDAPIDMTIRDMAAPFDADLMDRGPPLDAPIDMTTPDQAASFDAVLIDLGPPIDAPIDMASVPNTDMTQQMMPMSDAIDMINLADLTRPPLGDADMNSVPLHNISFANPVPVPGSPHFGIVAAPLFGLKIDLAISGGDLKILQGNGLGGFAVRQQISNFVNYSYDVAAADLNKDNIFDLIVSNQGDDSVTVFLANSPGVFPDPPYNIPSLCKYPYGAAVVDIDRDMNPDIVVACGHNFELEGQTDFFKMQILWGDGSGKFTNRFAIPTPAGMHGPTSIAGGDFDGDGAQDFAVTFFQESTVVLFLNKTSLMSKSAKFDTQQQPKVVTNPTRLAAVDLDRDGWLDLAVVGGRSQSGASFVSLLYNQSGTLRLTTSLPTSSYSAGVAAGDFNRDGWPDLVVSEPEGNAGNMITNYGCIDVFLTDNGTLSTNSKRLKLQAGGMPWMPWMMAVGDFNRDDKVDIAVSATTGATSVDIFINTSTP